MAEYRYRISRFNGGSDKYGPCEVCSKQCDTFYWQTEERKFLFDGYEDWTAYQCHSLGGHRECLEAQQRNLPRDVGYATEHWNLVHGEEDVCG